MADRTLVLCKPDCVERGLVGEVVGRLVEFITRSPLVALVAEGPDAYKVVRTLMGTTNPREAAPGTIRGDLAIELTENLVHGSDGPESAAREIALFFPGLSG